MDDVQISKNFVVFEGIDGAGKSTQAQLVSSMLHTKQITSTITREPFDGIIGTYIRSLLQGNSLNTISSAHNPNIASALLAYLFTADRYEHLYNDNGILALLDSNDIVICDRYLFSSIAYQGAVQVTQLTRELNVHFPLPQMLVYFDIKPKDAMRRMIKKAKDSLETLENLQAVYDRYESVIQEYENRYTATNKKTNGSSNLHILRIDAMLPVQKITETITNFILSNSN